MLHKKTHLKKHYLCNILASSDQIIQNVVSLPPNNNGVIMGVDIINNHPRRNIVSMKI
jgi:hypothetical protein